MAAVKDISVNAAKEAVLSKLDGIFRFKKKTKKTERLFLADSVFSL